jgi:hypothetical protein
MASPALELDGTWEEILAHAEDLAGRRVRLIVLPIEAAPTSAPPELPPTNQQMLELLDELKRTPLTAEEQAVLDGLHQHLQDHPFSLRGVEDAA